MKLGNQEEERREKKDINNEQSPMMKNKFPQYCF